MRNLINSVAATAICAMVGASLAPSQAAAGVVGIGEQTAIRSASPVEQIYYRRYYHRHYYHPYYRRHYYHRRYYGYNPYYYNPAAAVVGTAAAVATIPFWGGDTLIEPIPGDVKLASGAKAREASRRFASRLAR